MSVSAVDHEVLRGGMAGLRWGKEEDRHGGNLGAFGHAVAERDAVGDGFECRGGIVAGVKPTLVERREDFGGENAVDANAERQELGRPLAGEGELRSLGGGVRRGSSLTCKCNLGADVDNRSAGLLQHRQGEVGHGIVVEQILAKALEEAFGIAAREAYAVVGTRVIDEAVEATVLVLDVVDCMTALLGFSEMGFEEVATGLIFHLVQEVLDVVGGPAEDDNDGAFVEAGAGDRLANASTAAADGDDTILESEVHSFSGRGS
jgi:hypothetical protein